MDGRAYRVTSPLEGMVTRREASVGAFVTTEDLLFEVVDTRVMWAEVAVAELDIGALSFNGDSGSGLEVVVTVPSLGDRTFVGRVAYNKFDPKHGLDFNGYSAEAGIRTAFGAHAEVYAMAGYEDYSKKHGINPEGQLYGRLGGQVKLNQNWGINGDLKMDRDGNKEWSVGPRFSW